MKYVSTRSKIEPINSAEAIIRGIADDGGLFVPESFPKIEMNEIEKFVGAPYVTVAEKILQPFLTDFTEGEIGECCELAYNYFDLPSIAPLGVLVPDEKNPTNQTGVAELWHGPTSAFKDFALQMLPRLMSVALKKTGEKRKILILVATSGDTGKAALAGFADVPQTKIMVFYPDGGVSKIQRLQMVTQTGNNVNVVALRGNFDDVQTGVKKIFGDKEIAGQLDKAGVKLSSANSINWGRLVPQIVYYFSSYARFVSTKQIKLGDKINIVVPTGNFGNILAAYYAKRMGLPVNKLICASNENHILTDFFRTGVYDRNRKFYKTITPSMDILISGNLERLLYHESGNAKTVQKFMQELNDTGKYKIDKSLKKKLDKIFYADYATEAETSEAIKGIFGQFKYLIDTHTAVAFYVLNKYRKATDDMRPAIVASTASPFKFPGAVLNSLGQNVEGIDEFKQLRMLETISNRNAPRNLSSLDAMKILHEDVCDKEEMPERVLKFAAE